MGTMDILHVQCEPGLFCLIFMNHYFNMGGGFSAQFSGIISFSMDYTMGTTFVPNV